MQAFDTLTPVRAERRIVILISDGLDNSSRTSADSVIDAAIARRVSFYVIHLPLFEPRDGRLAVRRPSKGFRDLAEKTGGKYFLVGDAKSALQPQANDLTPIFQAIEEVLEALGRGAARLRPGLLGLATVIRRRRSPRRLLGAFREHSVAK